MNFNFFLMNKYKKESSQDVLLVDDYVHWRENLSPDEWFELGAIYGDECEQEAIKGNVFQGGEDHSLILTQKMFNALIKIIEKISFAELRDKYFLDLGEVRLIWDILNIKENEEL